MNGKAENRSAFRGHLNTGLLFLCVVLWPFLFISCGSKPVDPRTVIPADSLVYLETADLGRVMEAVTANPSFQKLASTKPDTSALRGIRLAIGISGFQTSEEDAADENAVLAFRPRFVAVAETNSWNYQALSFAENKLGEFVNDIYGGEVELVTVDKHNGKYLTWTAKDGRKAFALVRGSLILFGNDETAIDNCVNVMNGGADSMAKNAEVSSFTADSLASGYLSTDGVAQLANLAGVSLAITAGEESEVKSFIARVLPEIVRNSITDGVWQARSENGLIEDSFMLSVATDTAKVLGETVVPGGRPEPELARLIPKEFESATRYDLKDPQIAWRGLVLTASSKTDQLSGSLITAFSSSLFEAYGIEDPELFLSSVSGPIHTVRFDAEGDDVAVIARIKDATGLKRSLAKEINLTKSPARKDAFEIWVSDDGELAAAIGENTVLMGDTSSVEKCIAARSSGADTDTFRSSNAAIVTAGRTTDPDAKLVTALTGRKEGNFPLVQNYLTETRFNQKGMERRTISDFGLIGAILAQLDRD